MSESFLNGRVTLHAGDSLDVLRTLADSSIDSVCTDPPYALVSIGKRFGKPDAAACKVSEGRSGAYARASAGFMGAKWDTGDRAFAVEFWAEVYRVLKPGGHVLAFGGTRTVHRLICAIEDAGFEIRDMIAWLYGSGFPKSHDVSKGIDKRPGVERHPEFAADLRAAMAAKGYTNTFDVAEKVIGRRTGAVANWQKYQWPEAKWWPALRDLLEMSETKWGGVIVEAERIRTGIASGTRLAVAPGRINDRSAVSLDVTSAATDAARQWDGWGTALKPALKPITFARKPLLGTVAANVLAHGTGALNIDGCRIEGRERSDYGLATACRSQGSTYGTPTASADFDSSKGRWPANVLHDGEAISGETGRYFYNAKADSDDRIGSKHTTVKPVDLMRWCCRLVTPPGGVVLDPFAGTGTTGEAAFYEGFSAVLIEREAEYRADIARRMKLVMSGPDERRRAIVKAKAKPDDLTGTLFAPPPPMAAE